MFGATEGSERDVAMNLRRCGFDGIGRIDWRAEGIIIELKRR